VRSPNYIFLFRLRLSRAITRCARKNPFADNALKRRAHGADSNYEHLYLQFRRLLHHPRHHPLPSHPFPFHSPIVIILLPRYHTYMRFVVYVFTPSLPSSPSNYPSAKGMPPNHFGVEYHEILVVIV